MEVDKRFTICRLCLRSNDDLFHVFETKGIREHNLADLISELLRHEVSSEDIYPQCVCTNCVGKLGDFKEFKDQCTTHRKLLDRAYTTRDVSSKEINTEEGATIPVRDSRENQANENVGFSVGNMSANYKWCIVPHCVSTSKRTPGKVFVSVPKAEAVRRKWFKAVRREPPASYQSTIFCCEDHFKMNEDFENFIQYRMMGGKVKLRVKDGVVPHIFHSRNDGKRASTLKPRMSVKRRQREMTISDAPWETAGGSCTDHAGDAGHQAESLTSSQGLTSDESQSNNAISSQRTSADTSNREIENRVAMETHRSKSIGCNSKISERNDVDRKDGIAEEIMIADTPLLEPKIEPDEECEWKASADRVVVDRQGASSNTREIREPNKYFQEDLGSHNAVSPEIPLMEPKIEPDEELVETGGDWETVGDRGEVDHQGASPNTRECAIKDPLASGDSEDENLSNAHEWDKDEGHNDNDCSMDGVLNDAHEDPLACRDSGEGSLSSTAWKANDGDMDLNEKECFADGASSDSKDSSDSSKEIDFSKEVFQCPICGKPYICASSYQRHIRAHKFGRTLECSHCPKRFPDRKALSAHMKIHLVENVRCHLCSKTFRYKDLLDKHLVRHGDRIFKCDHCDKAYYQLSELNVHGRTQHEDKMHRCDICSRFFLRKVYLDNHKVLHSGECAKKYECSVCGLNCVTQSQLTGHFKGHSIDEPIYCSQCGMSFADKLTLGEHMNTRHSSSKQTSFPCDQCGQKYSTLPNLKRHKRSGHFGWKEFSCVHCGKEFTQKQHMIHHVKENHSESVRKPSHE